MSVLLPRCYPRWSREKAIEFLSNSTFMTRTQIEKEVDRYITWPGQACAYKIGELKIRELRDRAITKLGEKGTVIFLGITVSRTCSYWD